MPAARSSTYTRALKRSTTDSSESIRSAANTAMLALASAFASASSARAVPFLSTPTREPNHSAMATAAFHATSGATQRNGFSG